MKVKDVIKILMQLHQEAEVMIYADGNGSFSIEDISISDGIVYINGED